MYRQVSSFWSCLDCALTYSGQVTSQQMYCTIRYRQVRNIYWICPSLFPIRAKEGPTLLVPPYLGTSRASVMCFPRHKQQMSCVVYVGICSFPVWDQIQYFTCLQWQTKYIIARLGFILRCCFIIAYMAYQSGFRLKIVMSWPCLQVYSYWGEGLNNNKKALAGQTMASKSIWTMIKTMLIPAYYRIF